ncbi:MAG: type II and III secretion system protein family protein [Alphaproteobacteria bacterium]|nr:type II and III secretion system protein family protein [Alphaproteobacteria bacterium]
MNFGKVSFLFLTIIGSVFLLLTGVAAETSQYGATGKKTNSEPTVSKITPLQSSAGSAKEASSDSGKMPMKAGGKQTFLKSMTLELSDAKVIHFGSPVAEIFIVNPEIADVQLSSPHTAYVFAKSPGSTKLFAINDKGKEIMNIEISVIHNISRLKELISPFDPYDLIELKSLPGSILIEGQADSPKTAEEVRSIVERFMSQGSSASKSGDASLTNVINRLTIKSPVQVKLHVKIAEVARDVLNKLSINWQATISNTGGFNFGALTGASPFTTLPILTNNVTSINQPASVLPDTNVSTLGFNYSNQHVNINSAIDLLSREGLVTVLAEPNLLAVSGETASFLAGGEFPYPVPQQLGNITVDFKQYGVSLAFTPTVLDGGLISMRVRPEVSELDPTTGITIVGLTVPGILTRWAETTVELASGQTFAIAGLLKNQNLADISALPGLGDLPIIGPLFRSNQFRRQESELVILITPYLAEPAPGKEMLLPTDGMNFATFVEQIFERRLVKEGTQKGQAPAFGPGGVRLIGPAGFSVE